MKDEIARQLGAPDIIFNSAVIQYRWAPILEQAPDDYASQFEGCVLHNVLMAQAFVPGMIAKKWRRVIAINTECAMQCWPNQSAYAAGKHGVDGVLRVLAKEVGEHGITVNQVAPGWMVSESRSEVDRPDWYRNGLPLKRFGHDQDIANAVAFLASDLAGFITGVYLPVCGPAFDAAQSPCIALVTFAASDVTKTIRPLTCRGCPIRSGSKAKRPSVRFMIRTARRTQLALGRLASIRGSAERRERRRQCRYSPCNRATRRGAWTGQRLPPTMPMA